jgi:hypothetical protein
MDVYLLIVGSLQALFSVAVLVFALVILLRRGWRPYLVFARQTLVFNALLLLFGCLANSLWMLLAYNRWYISADTLVDFIPFIPFGQWVLNVSMGKEHGHLIGGTRLYQLQLLWLLLAGSVWACTIAAYRSICEGLMWRHTVGRSARSGDRRTT